MHFHSSLNRIIVVLGVLVIGAVVTPRSADAAVTACVHKVNGNVRIVDSPNGCSSNETSLSLSTSASPAVSGSAPESQPHAFNTCPFASVELVTLPVVLTDRSTIQVSGQAILQRGTFTGAAYYHVIAQLLMGDVVLASRRGTMVKLVGDDDVSDESIVSGPLLDNFYGIYTAPPGSYTLRLLFTPDGIIGCQPLVTPGNGQLSFQTQPAS
jgi:hypothetical protein